MKISDFKVGQIAYLFTEESKYRPERISEVTVTNVGRKYVTIDFFDEQYNATGRKNDNFLVRKGYSELSDRLFFSRQDIDDYKETQEIRVLLRKQIRWDNIEDIPLDKLRKIKKILEE